MTFISDEVCVNELTKVTEPFKKVTLKAVCDPESEGEFGKPVVVTPCSVFNVYKDKEVCGQPLPGFNVFDFILMKLIIACGFWYIAYWTLQNIKTL